MGEGGGGVGRFLIQILSDTLDYLFPSHTFLQRTYYFFHISQTAKICLKNRYFEKQIHWVPLLIDGFWSKALLLLLRHETIPSQRSAVVTIGCSVCCLIISTHASGISIPLSSDDVISSFGWSIFWEVFFFQQCLFLLQFHNLQVIFASFLLELPGFIWV